MRATSIEAFFYILENLGERQLQVFLAVKEIQPCYNLKISKHLHLPINCITGRMRELKDLSMVRLYKKEICPETNMKVEFWIIPAWMKDVLI